jgi:hypothetical protein
MNALKILLSASNGYKTYSAAILATLSGLGMILTKTHCAGVAQILHALMIIFGAASLAGLRHAVAKVATGSSTPQQRVLYRFVRGCTEE